MWFFKLDFKPFLTIINENSPSWKVLFPSIQLSNGRKKLGPKWWTHTHKTKIRIETDEVPRPRIFTNDESKIITRNVFY